MCLVKTLPLLMVHGWPGSVWEFYKILPMLTDETSDVTFEVICPSIPGYGYSEAAHKPGNINQAQRHTSRFVFRVRIGAHIILPYAQHQ